jgi:tellurite resistance protein
MDLKGIEKHAEAIKSDLAVPKQNEVFEAAAEAGYLAANSDGKVDDEEREMLVKAIEILSTGAVIEWEVESLLESCAAREKADGAAKRAEAVGDRLKTLGQPEAGLLFAAFVAQASGGIDKEESAVLHSIGKAAGLAKQKVTALLKKVGAKEA